MIRNYFLFLILLFLFLGQTSVSHASDEFYKSRLKHFEAMVKQNPNDFKTHYNLGVAYASLGRYLQSIAPLMEAIRLKADDAESYSYPGKE